jgi:P27 family predicted phage terminase small subunit
MGKRGPKPTPTNIRKIRGAQDSKLAKNEPEFGVGVGTPPAHLPHLGKKCWNEIAPMLTRAGVISPADAKALEMYCFIYAEWRQAIKALKREGSVMTHSTGSRQVSAEYTVAKGLLEQLLKLSREFGMTPSSRTSINSMIDDAQNDDMDKLLFG